MGSHRGQRAAGYLLLLVGLLAAGAAPADGSASAGAGAWSWPLAGPDRSGPAVLRRFAVLPSPWLPGHRGVDLAAAVGQPVLAPADGVVVFAGTVVDRGVLTLQHASGLRTSYEPIGSPLPVGTSVVRGGQAAVVGSGRDHCPAATCLHWGLRRGETYLDPLLLVRTRPPMVLLPLGGGSPAHRSLRSRRAQRPDLSSAPEAAAALAPRPGAGRAGRAGRSRRRRRGAGPVGRRPRPPPLGRLAPWSTLLERGRGAAGDRLRTRQHPGCPTLAVGIALAWAAWAATVS